MLRAGYKSGLPFQIGLFVGLVAFSIGAAQASVSRLNAASEPMSGSGVQNAAPASAPAQTTSASAAAARARRAARRRAARRRALAAASTPAQPAAAPVNQTAAQRQRDQQILTEQQAQSARIARENDSLTKKYIRDQQQVQAEPRIQDAPGPGDAPLAGAPAVQAARPSDSQGIQDAPGPSQTLPQTPPPAAPDDSPAQPAPQP